MELLDKLAILADAAKYDAACTSSGVRRGSRPGMIGNTSSSWQAAATASLPTGAASPC